MKWVVCTALTYTALTYTAITYTAITYTAITVLLSGADPGFLEGGEMKKH